jgi:phosphatidylserine decarboxylase
LEEKRVLAMPIKPLISSLFLSYLILLPLSIKWELKKNIVLPAAFVIGLITWGVTELTLGFWNLSFYLILILQVFVIAVVSIVLLLWRFYRDPERVSPEDENLIVSPADGRIIYVKKIEEGKIPFSEKNGKKFSLQDFVQSDLLHAGGYLLGIAMNYLDVHVNRAPIGGKITLLKHIKGLFISLKKKEAIVQNERVLTVIENDQLKIGIVQIASRLVRKIVPFLRQGDEIQRGERLGVIRLGSQVDLILPDLHDLRILVKPGQEVKAGLSAVASFEEKNLNTS